MSAALIQSWTALDRLGHLARVDMGDGQVTFDGEIVRNLRYDIHTPVFAVDPETGFAVLAYCCWRDDSVKVLTTFGELELGLKVVGKWGVAVAVEGPGRILVAWLANIATVVRARITLTSLGPALEYLPPLVISPSQLLLELSPDGTPRGEGDEGGPGGHKHVTRNGRTIPLIYWTEENGRVVGAEGGNAPNRILLADVDGWYIADNDPKSALLPARLDIHGNVSSFEGHYATNAEIRTRPLFPPVPEPVPTPIPVPVPVPPPPPPPPPPAPIDCAWSPWSPWSEWKPLKRFGRQRRYRARFVVAREAHGGRPCEGEDLETEDRTDPTLPAWVRSMVDRVNGGK